MHELYDFAYSSSAHRVRIALNLKGVDYTSIPIGLTRGEQHDTEFRTVNPQGRVPVYSDDLILMNQSLAIIEYLNERYPQPPLLSSSLQERALARQVAALICTDIHPLNAFRVLGYLWDVYKVAAKARRRWLQHWLMDGLDALELWLSVGQANVRFCAGDAVSIGDVCLIPQLDVARRNKIDIDEFPRLAAIEAACLEFDAFRRAGHTVGAQP